MEIKQIWLTKFFLGAIGLLAWFALITQFIINLNSHAAARSELVIRFFSYFTILTNLLVAICCTSVLINPKSKWGIFFSKQKTITATTVYILVVGLIYNTILRFIWNPEGIQKVVDELLHSAIPLLFLLFWVFFLRKKKLKWNVLFSWLLYPLIYLIYILIRGAFSHFYPYPFIDVDKLGYIKTFWNALGVTLVFVSLFLIFIGLGNLITRFGAINRSAVNQ